MFNNTNIPYSVPVTPVAGTNNGGLFGGDSWAWIIVLLLLFGWGGNGNGFGGFGGGNSGVANEVQRGFDNQSVLNKLNGLENGLCDGFYSQNTTMLQGFNGLQQTAMNGFHGVDNAICNLGYNVQSGFNGLSAQLAQCCCDNRAAIADVKYQMATDTCDIKHAINDSTRNILDFLVNDKIATLQAENQNLKLKASQAEQNAYLVNELRPCPVPAYITCNPYSASYGIGYGNGCGCGC